MTFQIGLMLAALAVAVVLFSLEWLTADTIALGLLVTLVLTGLLPVERAFDGFGSNTVIVILALLILTAALTRTGMIDLVGRAILRRTGDNPERLLAVIMVGSAAIGAFMSNTAATAFFVPIVIGIAQRAGFSASKLLLPLAFAGILSSSVSLISTSSNLVISGLMTQKGLAPMGMFELAPVGIPIAVAGLLYMYFIGRRLTPDRGGSAGLIEQFGVMPYLAEALIPPGSPLVGKTLGETKFGSDLDLTVLEVIRDKDRHFAPRTTMKLAAGDVLLVEGRPDEILKIKGTAGVEIKADVKLADPDLEDDEMGLVEAILMPGSPLLGRTLKGARFRERYGLQVIGMNRRGTNLRSKLSTVQLRMGDVLLVQGPRVNLAALNDDHTFRVLGSLEEKLPRGRRALLAGAIFAAAILLGTFKIVPLSDRLPRGLRARLRHALHHPGGGVSGGRVARADPHRQHARLWRGDGAHRHRELPRRPAPRPGRRRQPALAAHRLLLPHRGAHAAHVEPGRRRRDPTHRDPDRAERRPEPAHLCDDGRRRREHLLPHAAGALLHDGLRPRSLSVRGFCESRRAPDGDRLRPRDPARPALLAAAVSIRRRQSNGQAQTPELLRTSCV